MKNKISHLHYILLLTGAALLILTACQPAIPPADPQKAGTLAAQTVQAVQQQQTLSAFETLAAQLTRIAQATATATLPPTATATLTPTPIPPTQTHTPTATPTRLRCNWAEFVRDISVADGTVVGPGQTFTKTWRLRNIGSCTWTTQYSLVFVGGEVMGAPTRIGLSKPVAPGGTVDLAVLMQAPTSAGAVAGYWMLEDAAGSVFGIGSAADSRFWVKVVVEVPEVVAFNFADRVCTGVWYSATTNPLPCPGDPLSLDTGFVVRQNEPRREDGVVENEPGIITSPDATDNLGKIVGIFPPFTVQKGDQFKAVIGCLYDMPECDVYFDLRYKIGTGRMQDLASWHEVYDGEAHRVAVDLSALAGREVRFVLRVRNNNSAVDNQALWIMPRIMR